MSFPRNAKGELSQWGKHPNTLFVSGVERARIAFKGGKLFTRYESEIPDQEQRAKFRNVVDVILNGMKGEYYE
jgi:hypothetical protein